MKRYLPLLAILGLLAALVAATAATAASPARPTTSLDRSGPSLAHLALRGAVDDEEEGEEFEAGEGEFEFEECGAAEEEFEDAEESELEEEEFEIACEDEIAKGAAKDAPFVTAPMACQVRRAESTITALPGSDQVRLTVRYQTYAPTRVTLALKLRDKKGAVGIEHTTKQMAGKGVLHITTKLGSAVMERALKATEFDVGLRAPETPGYCAADLEQRLHSVKHTGADTPRVYSNS